IEGAVAIVAQKRIGMAPAFTAPGAAKNEHIRETVVVVIRLHDVQPANFANEAGLGGAISERAIAVVMEQAKLFLHVPTRDHEVEITVAIEIFQDHSAGPAEEFESTWDRASVPGAGEDCDAA